VFVTSPEGNAASFDCTKARSPSEKVTCATPELSSRDDELSRAFRKRKAEIERQQGDVKSFIAGEHQSLTKRAACGTDLECLRDWYDQRIAALGGVVPAERRPENSSANSPKAGDAPAPLATQPELLSFGSRVGMEVTVVAKQNIGTTHAVIRGVLTDANAKRFCAEYAHDQSQNCIKEFFDDNRLSGSIGANCTERTFTTFYGAHLRFVGKSTDPNLPEYIVQDQTNGSILDESGASGLSYDVEQFKALCPNSLTLASKADIQRVMAFSQMIDRANEQGTKYAETHETDWKLSSKVDEMTDHQMVTVTSIQESDGNAIAQVTGTCVDGMVLFKALVVDDAGKPTIELANQSRNAVMGELRINDAEPRSAAFLTGDYVNEILLPVMGRTDRAAQFLETHYNDIQSGILIALGGKEGLFNDVLTTWRIYARLKTSSGTLLIELAGFVWTGFAAG
jgi:uncharacterized protein